MNPFIKYPGGKMKEFHFVNQFKPKVISRYFEPFVGGGSIYLNIGITNSYINDKSEDLIHLYRYIQTQDTTFFNYLRELDRLWKMVEGDSSPSSTLFDLHDYSNYFTASLSNKKVRIQKLQGSGLTISKEDKQELFLTAKKTALYMCIRDFYNHHKRNSQQHTACFYFMREYCYSSMFRFSKAGVFNVPYGGRSYNFKYITSKIDFMQSPTLIEYLQNTNIYRDTINNN